MEIQMRNAEAAGLEQIRAFPLTAGCADITTFGG
jgi:hypothetical protein